MKRFFWMLVAVLGMTGLFTGCASKPAAKAADTAPVAPDSQNVAVDIAGTFTGAWEKISNNEKLMFYFLGETYVLYVDDKLNDDGVFTIDGNKLYLWPYDTGFYLYTFAISNEGLTLKKNDVPAMSGLWTRSAYNESAEAESEIVGAWKNESANDINFLRFYPRGGGSWFHCNKKTLEVEKFEKIKHDLSNSGVFEQIIKSTGEGWSMGIPVKIQYTVEGDKLVLTKDGSVYIKQ